MKAIGVIPARYASTRFAGKVLADLAGKPVIQHVWERASQATKLDTVIIACDDERILKAAKDFGAQAVLTSRDHASGSDRIAEAVASIDTDIVVNIQGDEPLIEPTVIDDLVQALFDDSSCVMATVIKKLDDIQELQDPNVVKVTIDKNGCALYFSRSEIPFNREKNGAKNIQYYKHLGLYAYRKEFLAVYTKLPRSHLEEIEQLEQLRALEAGYKIKTIETTTDTIGIDTRQDLEKVAALLKKARV